MGFKSLQVKFFLVTSLSFGLALLFIGFAFSYTVNSVELKIGKLFAEKQVLYYKERSLRPILKEINTAKRLANSTLIKEWALDEQDEFKKRRGIAELENYRTEFSDQSYFFALAKSGHYYYNDAKTSYTNQQLRYVLNPESSNDAWLYKTIEQDQPCLLNVDYDVKIKVLKVWINCVVRVQGKALGVIGTGIDLTTFITTMLNDSQLGVSNLFLDRSGAIQAYRNTDEIDLRSISKNIDERKTFINLLDLPQDQEAVTNILKRLQSEEQFSTTSSIRIKGKNYLAGFAYIKELGWYNITLMEMGSWVNTEMFIPFLVLTVIALFVLILSVGFAVQFQLLNRIGQLKNNAQQISQGNYEITIDDHGTDEISYLSHEFQHMSEQVREYTENLEDKIIARTIELEKAIHTKDTFVSILAHDLRGPIGSLATMFNETDVLDYLKQPALLSSARISIQSTYDLLESLLVWGKLQNEDSPFEPEIIFLKPFLKKICTLFELQTSHKMISIVIDCPDNISVYSDPQMISLAIRNFISNGIKYSLENSQITVQAQSVEKEVEISILDQGIGIAPDKIENIFSLGIVQTSTLGTHQEQGAGLGLTLCKELVDQNKGEIGVESELGRGSRFWIKLPSNPA